MDVRALNRTGGSRSQLCEMFVPDPADLICRVILIFGKPEFAFFADDVEDLSTNESLSSH